MKKNQLFRTVFVNSASLNTTNMKELFEAVVLTPEEELATEALRIIDPKIAMILNRLIHALLSMCVVYFGIRITDKLASRKEAITVGWILALLWLMPFMSVRNLVEMVSAPFLMWGIWLLLNHNSKKYFFLGGVLVGLSISFRYQIAIFAVGVAFYYLIKNNPFKMINN